MKVEVITTTCGEYDQYANVRVLVDGVQVINGHIGGEPEDNTYSRDYAWIDDAFLKLARALGAEATLQVENEPE